MFIIYTLFALDMLNISLFLPIFNKYVISLGGTHHFIEIVGISTALISIIWKPIAGYLSDSRRRKEIILWCMILCLIGNIMTYFSSSLLILFCSRLFCAFGSPVQTLLKTTATTVAGPNNDGIILNKIGILLAICFMTGAILSGFLSEYSYGYSLVFIIISINLIIALVLANLLPEERSQAVTTEALSKRISITKKLVHIYKSAKLLKWSLYWEVFLIKWLLDISFGLMQMSMGFILLNYFKIEGRYIGYIFFLFGVVSIFTNLVLVKIKNVYYINDIGYLRIVHACALLSLSYLGLGLSSVYFLFLLSIVMNNVARTVLDATLFELLNNKARDNEKGTIVSLFDGVLSLSELIAPILSSMLVTLYGERVTVLLCCIPSALGAGIAFYKQDENKLHVH